MRRLKRLLLAGFADRIESLYLDLVVHRHVKWLRQVAPRHITEHLRVAEQLRARKGELLVRPEGHLLLRRELLCHIGIPGEHFGRVVPAGEARVLGGGGKTACRVHITLQGRSVDGLIVEELVHELLRTRIVHGLLHLALVGEHVSLRLDYLGHHTLHPRLGLLAVQICRKFLHLAVSALVVGDQAAGLAARDALLAGWIHSGRRNRLRWAVKADYADLGRGTYSALARGLARPL